MHRHKCTEVMGVDKLTLKMSRHEGITRQVAEKGGSREHREQRAFERRRSFFASMKEEKWRIDTDAGRF